jgi:Raf kinase inhibitor-like YbhB/YbcL family protein
MPTKGLKISSPAFEAGSKIPDKYTCKGDDISPPLRIEGVDPAAKSLVLVMEDPDASMGTWYHWVKFNMPASTTKIAEGVEPQGTSGQGTGENLKYIGPCPPRGTHRYVFTVCALNIALDLPEGGTYENIASAMDGHVIQRGELMGKYSK